MSKIDAVEKLLENACRRARSTINWTDADYRAEIDLWRDRAESARIAEDSDADYRCSARADALEQAQELARWLAWERSCV